MATFTGTSGNNSILAVTTITNNTSGATTAAQLGGATGGTLAELQDGTGDTINAGAGNDLVIAGSGGDSLDGGTGDDSLGGMQGNDTINGGTGFDEARYDTEVGAGGVTVNLATGIATDRYGNTDTLLNIEAIKGTSSGDTLTGGNTANGTGTTGFLSGFETFRGLGGNDTINGGVGFDEARYDHDFAYGGTGAVTVNLATGVATDGFGATDSLSNIESIRATRNGDTLVGNAEDNTFFGLAGNDTITGGDGTDLVRYDSDANTSNGVSNGLAAVTVNLQTGTATDGYGNTDTFTSSNGIVTIDSVRGTTGADNFTGRNSVVHGDQFTGLGGADIINGGLGYDESRYDFDAVWDINTLAWTGGTGAITVNLAAGTATDGFGNVDTLTSIESARGSYQADSLTGSSADNQFRGFAGNDIIDGGAGDDTASYDGDFIRLNSAGLFGTGAVTVNLALGTATDGFGNTDTLISIENARGTAQADTFVGNGVDNTFTGYGGNDIIDGGAGTGDEVRYDFDYYWASNLVGVTVNFATGTAIDGFGNTDALSNIEGVRGTRAVDNFTGGAGDEFFRGLKGNDIINGGGGNDLTSYIADEFAKFESETLAAVTVNLATGVATDSWGGTDTLISIENVAGGMLGDTLTGSAGDNLFRGYGGNDSIDGAGGSDTVDYSRDQDVGDNRFLNGAGAIVVNLALGTATDGFGNTDTLTSIENAIGGAGNDEFRGVDGTINTFTGGAGSDAYYIGGDNDVVVELTGAGEGTGDRVHTSLAAYTLAANVEQLYASGATGARVFVGNAEGNIIQAGLVGSGVNADVIDGGAGADFMEGGDGSDTYLVDNIGDTVIGESAGVNGGFDVVIATANHTLSANVEQLVLQGGATTGTGNATANYLYGGNSGLSLTLNGMDGDDILFAGLAGGNTMNGGAGVDTLLIYGGNNTVNGGTGSDIYYTYTASDVLSESGGDGIDTVYATYSITVAEDIEQVLISGAATSITSNSLDDNNIFYGNSAAGAVTLNGGGGADVLFGGVNADALNGGAGVDLLFGNGGADQLAGGADTDVYYLTSGTEVVTELGGGGFDTAYSNAAGTTTMAANLEQLILYGAATGGVGNGDANYLYGHIAAGAVTLDGGAGADYLLDSAASGDMLIGGTGDDQLDLRTGGIDRVRFAAATGNDIVYGFGVDAIFGQDLIDVTGRGFSAASIGSAILITADGSDALITIGADTMRLVGVGAANVTASDFAF